MAMIDLVQGLSPFAARVKGTPTTPEEVERTGFIGQVQFQSKGYWHVGVSVGNGFVIHYTANDRGAAAPLGPGSIKKDRLRDLAVGYKKMEIIAAHQDSRQFKTPGQIVQTAEFFLQNPAEFGRYRVATHNCENFCHCCIYHNPPMLSDQTKGYMKLGAAALAGGYVALKMLSKR